MRTAALVGMLLVGCGMSGPAGAGTWAEWETKCVPGSDPGCVAYPARMLEVPGEQFVCSMGVAPNGETIATVHIGSDPGARLDLQELRFANGALVGCTAVYVTEAEVSEAAPRNTFGGACNDPSNVSDLSLSGRVISGTLSLPRSGPTGTLGARFAVLGSVHIECPTQ